MTTNAITTNGIETGKVWVNDFATQTSTLANAGDIAEIIGDISSEELDNQYDSLEALNADLVDFSFTEEAEY